MILSWTETIWIAMTANDTPLEQNLQETVIRQAEELGIAREDFPETFDETLEEWCELGEVLEVATFAVPPWAELAG